MTIEIKNDRENLVAFIEIKDGAIVEEKLKGCFITDIDGNDDGTLRYQVEVVTPKDVVKNISNETLLEEIRNRMIK